MLSKSRVKAGPLATGKISARDESVLNDGGLRVESVVFDFAEDGGLVGEFNFGKILPEGSIVVEVVSDEITAVTGADDVDLKVGSIALVSGMDLTADAGIQGRALDGSVAGIKVSSNLELKMDINTNPATAGKVRFFVKFLLPND